MAVRGTTRARDAGRHVNDQVYVNANARCTYRRHEAITSEEREVGRELGEQLCHLALGDDGTDQTILWAVFTPGSAKQKKMGIADPDILTNAFACKSGGGASRPNGTEKLRWVTRSR